MNKNFKSYTLIWTIALVIFNVLAFALHIGITGGTYGSTFWIGYISVLIGLIGQLICAYIALNGNLFYNYSVFSVGYIGLAVIFVAGILCIAIPQIPAWIAIIVCVIILAVNAIKIIKARAPIDIVERIDKEIKTKTFFIKSLTADAASVMDKATTAEIKTIAEKVWNEIRYSDPMSDNALASVESQITIKFEEFSETVEQNDIEHAQKLANEVIILIKNRNSKCKLLK